MQENLLFALFHGNTVNVDTEKTTQQQIQPHAGEETDHDCCDQHYQKCHGIVVKMC